MPARWMIAILLLVPAAPCWSLDQAPTPAAAVGRAVRQLAQETRKETPAPPRQQTDFFEGFEWETDGEEATKRLLKPQDSNDRIDAYIRWQLTAIADPSSLPDGRHFQRMLERLPPLPTNPRSDERTIRRFEQEVNRRYPTEKSVSKTMAAWQELEQQSRQQETWAEPGRALRRWIVEHAPDNTTRLQAMLESVHAEIAAGWNPDRRMRQLEDLCGQLGNRQSLDEKQVADFAKLAMSLTKTRKPLASNARAEELVFTVNVRYIAIRDYDVNRWVKRLRYGAAP